MIGKLPPLVVQWGLVAIVALGTFLLIEVVAFGRTLIIGNQSFAVIGEDAFENRAVPVGGIVMWWGNWEAEKTKLTNYELCDGGKVYTEGSKLKDKLKPNFMKAFPRGLAQGLTNAQDQARRSEAKEEISLRHRHEIKERSLASEKLWVPLCQQDGSFMWVEGNPGLYRRGAVSATAYDRVMGGAELAKGHYSAGTAVQGSITVPEQQTEDSGDEKVNILPTYQEVLFLIRVK